MALYFYNAYPPSLDYCFNAFPGIESGDAYQPKYAKDNNFVGWKPPPFDPDSTRYVFCLNDNLESQARDRFCKQGGYRYVLRHISLMPLLTGFAKGISWIHHWGMVRPSQDLYQVCCGRTPVVHLVSGQPQPLAAILD